MELSEKLCWYWISNVPEIGLKSIAALLYATGSIQGIFEASKSVLENVEGISSKLISSILITRNTDKIFEDYNKLKEKGIYFVTKEDASYPAKLKEIYEAPYYLYYKGTLPKDDYPSISIIGARNCTNYGKQISLTLSKELASYKIQIISGMARGIDSYAHYGAIEGQGSTFAILGCGVDICYPSENRELYENIIQHGSVISEYPMGTNPLPFHFPMRNRIISGLSNAVLVVEARESSGTFITVDRGLEQGKDIFAIPGRLGDSLSSGCNRLIQRGAKLILGVEDILEEILPSYEFIKQGAMSRKEGQDRTGVKKEEKNRQKNTKELKNYNIILEREEKIVYDRLSLEPKHLEILLLETGLSQHQLMCTLMSLELKNIITQWINNYYIRNI